MAHEEEDDHGERLINEGMALYAKRNPNASANGFLEYKTWKKNSPFLYDMILG